MPTQQITVSSAYPATPIINAGDGATLIQNTDTVNTVYIGDNYAVEAGNPNETVPLGPNSFLIVDGNEDLFAITKSGVSVVLNKLAGGLNFFLPFTSLTIPTNAVSGARIILDGVRGAILIYNAANLLVISISPVAGTDAMGAGYGPGVNVTDGTKTIQINAGTLGVFFILTQLLSIDGSNGLLVGDNLHAQVQLSASGGAGFLKFPLNAAGVNAPQMQAAPGAPSNLVVTGPQNTAAGQTDVAAIALIANNSNTAQLRLEYSDTTGLVNPWGILDDTGFNISPGSIVAADVTHLATPGSPAFAETWHSISLPSGLTGTARYRKAAELNAVWFDFQVTWTATVATTFNLGSLAATNFYPTVNRMIPMAWNGAPTGASAAPRIFVPTSGGLQILVPASSAGGSGGNSFLLPNN